MLKIAHVHADEVETEDTLEALFPIIDEALTGETLAALAVHATFDNDHELVVRALAARFPGVPLVGCSTDGFFNADGEAMQDGILVTLFLSDTLCFSAGLGHRISAEPEAAVATAVAQAIEGLDGPPVLCLTHPDGLAPSLAQVVQSLGAELGEQVVIVGGTAGDHWGFKETFQYFGDQVLQDALPVLLMSGPVQASVGVGSGWVPVGPALKVTEAEGHRIISLDGQPAGRFFCESLGLTAEEVGRQDIGEFPLAIFTDPESPHFFLRGVMEVEGKDGAIVSTAEVPVGCTVRMSAVQADRMIEAAREAMNSALDGLAGAPVLGTLVISCAARKWLLGTRVSLEAQALTEIANTVERPVAGFYSFGEIAPVASVAGRAEVAADREPRFHNETCVVLALGARSE